MSGFRTLAVAVAVAAVLGACTGTNIANVPAGQAPDAARTSGSHLRIAPEDAIVLNAQALPGDPTQYVLDDGEIVSDPPDDSATPDCVAVGNAPPNCTDTGAFRRFYSAPGQSFMQAVWASSSAIANNLPTPAPTAKPPKITGGYLYVEGFLDGALNGANTEAGFAYVAADTNKLPSPPHPAWFYAYMRGPNGAVAFSKNRWSPGGSSQNLSVQLYGKDASQCSIPNHSGPCAEAQFAGACATPSPSGSTCSETLDIPSSGWSSSGCCVMASMVSIAEQKPGRNWTNGYYFGPVDQVDCSAAGVALGSCVAPGQMYKGQSFPNDGTRVIVKNKFFLGTETDEINLHP